MTVFKLILIHQWKYQSNRYILVPIFWINIFDRAYRISSILILFSILFQNTCQKLSIHPITSTLAQSNTKNHSYNTPTHSLPTYIYDLRKHTHTRIPPENRRTLRVPTRGRMLGKFSGEPGGADFPNILAAAQLAIPRKPGARARVEIFRECETRVRVIMCTDTQAAWRRPLPKLRAASGWSSLIGNNIWFPRESERESARAPRNYVNLFCEWTGSGYYTFMRV